jgi:hypothetical protein
MAEPIPAAITAPESRCEAVTVTGGGDALAASNANEAVGSAL